MFAHLMLLTFSDGEKYFVKTKLCHRQFTSRAVKCVAKKGKKDTKTHKCATL